MWVVYVTVPKNLGWPWKPEYFPRKFAYKKDALLLAKSAKEQGGLNIKVEKQ